VKKTARRVEPSELLYPSKKLVAGVRKVSSTRAWDVGQRIEPKPRATAATLVAVTSFPI
jgi:hypothetical protein